MTGESGIQQRRKRRRLRHGSFVVLVVAVLLIAAGAVAQRVTTPRDSLDSVRPGKLTVASPGRWTVGAVSVEFDADGLTVTEAGRTVFASRPGESFVTGANGRVDWTEHRGYFWPKVRLSAEYAEQSVDRVTTSGETVLITGRLAGSPGARDYRLTVSPMPGGGVSFDLDAPGLDAVQLLSGRTAHAGVHGFGEQFSDFDLEGRRLPIVTREQGVGRGLQPLTYLADVTNHGAGGTEAMTYAAQSTYLTDDLRGLRLDPELPESQAFAVADITDPERVGLEVWAPRLRAELVAADTPAALVAAQQRGRPGAPARPELADWTQHGAIVGLQGGTDAVRSQVDRLTAAGTPVAGVWLQDWTGQRTTDFGDRLWWTWQLDRQRYPQWTELLEDLHGKGIRTTTYVNPFIVDAAEKPDGPARNLYVEARDAGFLVRDGSGDPYRLDQGGFDAYLVDLTNPGARQWFAEVIAGEVLGGGAPPGVDGFMADFAEGLPYDALLADGNAALAHNQWPRLWAQTVRQGCELAGKPDCVTWFRSGSLGMDAETPMFWTGDQLVDFGTEDGLASALRGTLSAGVSGWPLVHSDVGGYTSIDAVVRDHVRPDDLLARWAEFAAFGTMLRTHEGNRPGANAQVYDPAQAERFAAMSRVFAALAPYRAGVLDEARRDGVPAIRHGWLVHPGTAAARTDTQFFLGDSVLMAPVLAHDAATVEVTFPPGRWVHLFTGEVFAGDRTVTVDAPVGTPAAFAEAADPATPDLRAAIASALQQR